MAFQERLAAMKAKQEAAEQVKGEEAEKAAKAEKEKRVGELSAERERVSAELATAEAEAQEADTAIAEAEKFAAEQGENLDPEAGAEIEALRQEVAAVKEKFENLKAEAEQIDSELAALEEGAEAPAEAEERAVEEMVEAPEKEMPEEIKNQLETLRSEVEKGFHETWYDVREVNYGLNDMGTNALELVQAHPENEDQILNDTIKSTLEIINDCKLTQNKGYEEKRAEGKEVEDIKTIFDERMGVGPKIIQKMSFEFGKVNQAEADKLNVFFWQEFNSQYGELAKENPKKLQEILNPAYRAEPIIFNQAELLDRLSEEKELPPELKNTFKESITILKAADKYSGPGKTEFLTDNVLESRGKLIGEGYAEKVKRQLEALERE